MNTINQHLQEWASRLKFWQRFALDKVLCGSELTDEDLQEMVYFALRDNGLSKDYRESPNLVFLDGGLVQDDHVERVRITQLSNLKKVNALVDGQELRFGPGLTVIYGENGSGKSGYARVLASLAFSRGDRHVLPNIDLEPDGIPMSAEVHLKFESDDSIKTIACNIGKQLKELSSFYVFDSTSVRVHLTQSNAISFSPAGLASLPAFADAIDNIGKRLEEISSPHLVAYSDGFLDWFPGESDVSNALRELDVECDLQKLTSLSQINAKETAEIAALELQIAELKKTSSAAERARRQIQIHDLNALGESISRTVNAIRIDVAQEVEQMIADYDTKKLAARQISADKFKSDSLEAVGGREWHYFVEAAKSYADTQMSPPRTYPEAESVCLLCQQVLEPDAHDLIRRLWTFLESDAQECLNQSSTSLNTIASKLKSVDLSFFAADTAAHRFVKEEFPEIAIQISNVIQSYEGFRNFIIESIQLRSAPFSVPALDDFPIGELKNSVGTLQKALTAFMSEDRSLEINQLERKLTTFKHRIILREKITSIIELVNKRMWARKVKDISCKTNFITAKYNELFKTEIEDRYLETFTDIILKLDRRLNVRVETAGKKAKAMKRIVVASESSQKLDKDILDKVLSEGEKRAVAIADFLTEVRLDPNCTGIAVDDPVTSLDLEWRKKIAEMLCEEASDRQVIIFTHDLPFVYFLKAFAEQSTCPISNHWIRRGVSDQKPGYVFCDNSPALEKEYKNTVAADSFYNAAKVAAPESQEKLLKDGFGALRTSYEAFVIFILFNEVVQRFNERVSIGRLAQIPWDSAIVEQVIQKTELLSTYIEGHLHSDQLMAKKPTPAVLRQEIDDYNAMKKRFKELQKNLQM